MPSSQSYRQKWWIYYALRNSAFDACSTFCADDNGVKLTALKCPFEWYQVWYMFTQKIVSKSHLNKGHYTNSAEFPPYYNTFRPWRHFFVLVWAAVRAKARVVTCSSCTKSYWFCTQCLRALYRSLPLLQFPSKFVGVVSSIPSRSLNSSFSGNPHAWPSRHHFFRFGPFWWPFFRPNYLHYHRSYILLTYCSG